MDRYEVTNRQFKEFVDQGGYRDPQFWKHDFVDGRRKLAWEAAMKKFADATGRPGPAGWEASDYPEGEAGHPVTGISWYEAAAYAEFAGKSLPTRNHWATAAGLYLNDIFYRTGSKIKRNSNFNGEGIDAIGKNLGMSSFGIYDMAGNVREWCWNETQNGHMMSGVMIQVQDFRMMLCSAYD